MTCDNRLLKNIFSSGLAAILVAIMIVLVNRFYKSGIQKKQKEVFSVAAIGAFLVFFLSMLWFEHRYRNMTRRECRMMCNVLPLR